MVQSHWLCGTLHCSCKAAVQCRSRTLKQVGYIRLHVNRMEGQESCTGQSTLPRCKGWPHSPPDQEKDLLAGQFPHRLPKKQQSFNSLSMVEMFPIEFRYPDRTQGVHTRYVHVQLQHRKVYTRCSA